MSRLFFNNLYQDKKGFLCNCFSSAEGEGARFKMIDFAKEKDKWIIVEWKLHDKDFKKRYASEADLVRECRKLEGRDYDWVGILGEGTNTQINDESKFYCSEIAAWLMGIDNFHLSPAELYDELKLRGKIK